MTPNHRTSFQNLPPREDSSAGRAFNEFADEDVPAEYGYHVADSPGVTTPTGVPPRTARELMNGLYRTPGRAPEPANPAAPESGGPAGPNPSGRTEAIPDCDREDTVRLGSASRAEDSPEAPDESGALEEPEALEEWDDWEDWEEAEAPGTTRRTRWGISPERSPGLAWA